MIATLKKEKGVCDFVGDIATSEGVRIPPPAPSSDPIALVLPTILKLKSEGRKDSTLAPMLRRLKFLARKVDLENARFFQNYTNCL